MRGISVLLCLQLGSPTPCGQQHSPPDTYRHSALPKAVYYLRFQVGNVFLCMGGFQTQVASVHSHCRILGDAWLHQELLQRAQAPADAFCRFCRVYTCILQAKGITPEDSILIPDSSNPGNCIVFMQPHQVTHARVQASEEPNASSPGRSAISSHAG